MKSKKGLRLFSVCAVILLVLGNALTGSMPVAAAATGSATSTVTPTPSAPLNGGTVTVAISINMTAVNAPDNALGSFNGTLNWNTSVLSYSSNGGMLAGFIGAIDTSNVASGLIGFGGLNPSGVTGNNTVLNVTFNVISVGTSTLHLAYGAMSAASTFTDLTPILTVTDGSVTSSNPVVTLDPPLVNTTPTLDGTPTTGTANNTSGITFSYTTGSGSNRLLMVGVSWSSTSVTVSTVTFNSVALSSVGTSYYSGQARRVQIWRLLAPAASTTANVVVTFSGAVYGVAGAVDFAGVDQCTPLGTALGATGNTGTATVSPTSVAGDLVFDTVAAGTALTVNGSQAPQWNIGDGTNIYGGASTKTATGTTTTMSWTLTSGYWATYAVAIKPVQTAHSSSGTAATLSFCHGTGTGTNRLMLVGVSWNANTTVTTISSITFTPNGGSALPLSTVITEQNPWLLRLSAIYVLVNPPVGQFGNVLITFSGAVGSGAVAGAANFAGVDQLTPLGPAKGGDGISGATSVILTGLKGDELVFDNLFVGGSSPVATVGSGQTQLWKTTTGNALGAASTEQAAGSSVNMDWSLSTTSSFIWSDAAVPIIPACPGTRYTLTTDHDSNGSAVTLNPPGGSYCAGRIVTLTPVPNSGYLFNSWSGTNGSNVSTLPPYTIVMDGNKSVYANFATPSCQDVNLNPVADTYLSGAATSTNYGTVTSLQVAGTATAGSERTALLKWDVSSIPSNASISSASIILNVSDASTFAYPLYDLAKPFAEGSATWTNYVGTNAWGTAGAQLITGAIDRGTTNLWNSTTSSFNGTPPPSFTATVPLLDPAGLNVVRRWLTGGTNNGVIIQDYTASSTDSLAFDSREGTTPPVLKIHYCLGTPPTFTVTFDPNGGTGSMSPQVASSPTSLTANAYTWSGYTYNGWNTAADGSGTFYAERGNLPLQC